jgi:hypothetical protein
VISLNLVLAELRLGLKNRQVGEKWVSDDCSYLCKGLTETKYWLTKLVEDDMLSLSVYVNQPALYYLAQGGRGYLVKNELI